MKKIFLILSVLILFFGCENSKEEHKKETKKYFCIQKKEFMSILISSPSDPFIVENNKYFFIKSLEDLDYNSFDGNFFIPVGEFHGLNSVNKTKSRYTNYNFVYGSGIVLDGGDYLIPFNSVKDSKIVEK